MIDFLQGDVLDILPTLPAESVHCVVTSPPYWNLRDYGVPGQLGLESTPEEYVEKMVEVFRAVRRVLRDDGTLWLNLGSSYASGDTQPTRSPSDALACGNGDKGSQGSPGSDRACPCCGGELQDGYPSHPHHTGHTAPRPGQGEPRHQTTARDSERQDCAEASQPASLPDALPSTIPSSSESVPGVSGHEDEASEPPSTSRTSADGGHRCGCTKACTCGTSQNGGISGFHSLGMALSCRACGYSTTKPLTFKPKDLVPIPWMVAIALQADGWYLRSDVIWAKPNPMPESVTDRPTKAHEFMFLLTKNARYFYDADAVREEATCDRIRGPARHPCGDTNGNEGLARRDSGGARNLRTVWTIPTAPYPGAHFATFPPKLIEPCIKAGCPQGGTVLDPFGGSGTTAQVARDCGCKAILIELSEEYMALARKRNEQGVMF